MLKLEMNECMVIMQVMKETTIKGENAHVWSDIMTKIQKEIEKLAPDTLLETK